MVNLSRKNLAQNTLWNLVGQGLPFLSAIVATPLIIHALGLERFGILILAWAFISYFTLLDIGIGRALTILLTEKIGGSEEKITTIYAIVGSSLTLLFWLSLIATALAVSICPILVQQFLNIPLQLQNESLNAFRILGSCIPLIILINAFKGILMAYQRFDWINKIQIPLEIMTFIGPLLIIPFTHNISAIITVLAVFRIFAFFLYLNFIFSLFPLLWAHLKINKTILSTLLPMGGWLFLNNILILLIFYADRFMIGSILTPQDVSYYAVPLEMITKISIISGALSNVLFSAFGSLFQKDKERTLRIFWGGVKYVSLFVFPIIFLIYTFSHELLTIWIGREIASKSHTVLQWLAIGVFLHSLANIAFNLILGLGRPDLTVKLYLIEFPLYLLLIFHLIPSQGINGVAVARLTWISMETFLLFWISLHILKAKKGCLLPFASALGILIAIMTLSHNFLSPMTRGLYYIFITTAYSILAWQRILSDNDKNKAKETLSLFLRPCKIKT